MIHFKKKTKDLENKINSCTNNIKTYLQKGDKKSAKTWLVRRKNYEKYKQIYENTHITLIQQMLDIKNAEDNVKVTNILKSCNNLIKQVGVDRDEFLETCDDLKEQKDFQNEINTGFKELISNDDTELDDELNKLQKENENDNKQKLEFPNALNMPLNPFSFETQELYKE